MARNKYPEVTVEKILEAAQRLFIKKGYDQTTMYLGRNDRVQ